MMLNFLREFRPNILAVETIHAIVISEGFAEFIAIVIASILDHSLHNLEL